ncbi:phage head completion protein [Metapseudomonas otitidis]|uniref:Phage head completion protein n=1 Tax=Metapseudomonas otitidis TaxID=319939 RepID=A0A6S5RL22_9GAMM|nr:MULTISPECIES: head completion/stabilization protein [Pseudomonas]MDG9784340.1 head completion/stabilization protein [Pseudomonas otitidis]MDU9400174.1 head completion/stabilization protein [Pseudomonas sp. zfem003]BBT15117.1 phage head completion protein [Pseudomonas otitidis]
MSFSGKPTTLVEQVIENDGFWPDLGVAEFQKGYRLPAEYLVELLADGITAAMGEVNRDLAKRKRAWLAAGVTQVASADPLLLPERGFYVAIYKRAVYCRAKAYLLQQFATVNRRAEAANLAKEAPETHEAFLAYSQQAVRQIQGRGRVTAVLL